MSEVLKAIKERVSCKEFTPEMPAKELLEQIAEAGICAPSGMNKQAAKVIVITDKEVRDQLEDMNRRALNMPPDATPFYGAPVVAVIVANKAVPTYIYDGSLVAENMLLAAEAVGLGGCWIHRAKPEFEMEEGKALLAKLGIEGDWEGIANIILGYRADEKPAPKDRIPDRIYFVE